MGSDLERQITELKPGHHLCLICEDVAQQMAAIVPFVRAGLARGERCFCIADHSTTREVAAALAAAGVDVQRERERGALVLLTKRETYLRGGRFEPEAMIALLRQALEEALVGGETYYRVRVGSFASRTEAQGTAERLAALAYRVLIMESAALLAVILMLDFS